MRLLHAGADRQRDGAARARAAADPGADPRRDGRQPLPLRRLPEDRARDPARRGRRDDPRFVKTQTEMEGRYEDVWVLVDDADDVESWDADAELALVGRPAPRVGRCRAGRRAGAVHGRRAGSPGMLHAAVLRSPVAHGRVALARPRRRARGSRGPGRARAGERARR